MEIKDLEKTAEELLSAEGKVKGEVFLNHAQYIKRKEGKKGLQRIEERMAELGAPVKLEEINPSQWKNVGIDDLLVLVCVEQFQWTEDDVYEMGRFTSKTSFITKTLARYLVSREKVLREASRYWKSYYDFGSAETKEVGENYVVIEIKGYKAHPLICHLFRGYMRGMSQFISKSEEVEIEEIKCMHKGDDSHQFKISWKN